MRTTKRTNDHSGKVTASLVSVVGLVLVWGIVWANLPSREELLSAQPKPHIAAPPAVPELDLTIPGVPANRPAGTDYPGGAGESTATGTSGALSGPDDPRARQIAEVKCDAEVQQFCPDSLTGEERRRCVAQRLKRLPASCQQIMRQRIVRWKEAEGYKAACAEDVKRVCQGVEPGDGRIVQCLQDHAQDVSEPCYQSLPKGQLLLRN
jgi:hypothetical protein